MSEPRVTVATTATGQTVRVLDDLVTFALSGSQTAGAFTLLFDRVLPGGAVPLHAQTGQETFILIEGQLEFSVQEDGEGQVSSFTAERGTVVHVPEGVPHSYTNPTASPALMFVLFTPAGKTRQFFERLGVPVADPANPPPFVMPEPDALAAIFAEFEVRLAPPPARGNA